MNVPWTRAQIVTHLAGVVGNERAEEIVAEQLLAMRASVWTDATGSMLIDRLGAMAGTIGLAMRRLSRSRTSQPSLPIVKDAPREESSPRIPMPESRALTRLTAMLGATLGDAKARELVDHVVQMRHLRRASFGRAEAMIVLEDLAHHPGLVGTVARFAKARVHLEIE